VISIASFDPDAMTFGPFTTTEIKSPDPKKTNRPIVGLDIGRAGTVYSVEAFDPETAGMPDPDDGPFGSSVWRIGRVLIKDGVPVFEERKYRLVGRTDGFKTESVALRPPRSTGGRPQVIIGTDDENYGGVIRMLPPQQ
jgi:hypothetical protein